ncbi:CPBP family intramembrane metalloprotease [Chryseobacterium nematophagum]|uniref:CPBP family intramembrane metalloprotease n=1 Tax=Chryseobacterium nematophagum TaxID=2305228 RepID=A0A3M7TF53_9FLAO|nr:CPBP family intramembrane metalloprotease [Chryseobacterium nematophagum]
MFYNIFSKADFLEIHIFKKVLLVLGSYIFIYICTLFSLLFIAPADYIIVNILNYESIINLISESTNEISNENILKVIIIVPIIEEILFRLILKPNTFYISIFFLFFSFYILNGNFTKVEFTDFTFYIKLGIAILIAIIIYWKDKYVVSFINNHNKFFVIFSIILFGLAHISNIEPFHLHLILFYPVFIIPQIIIGYFITNIRMKLGFIWGILLHCLINLINIYL